LSWHKSPNLALNYNQISFFFPNLLANFVVDVTILLILFYCSVSHFIYSFSSWSLPAKKLSLCFPSFQVPFLQSYRFESHASPSMSHFSLHLPDMLFLTFCILAALVMMLISALPI
jgi:hypothetical protein